MPTPNPLRHDIAEMEHMLDEYLAFARGEGGEESSLTDLSELCVKPSPRERAQPDARIAMTAPGHATQVSVKRAGLRGAGQSGRHASSMARGSP